MPIEDDRLRAAIHDVLAAGGNVAGVITISGADKDQAQRVIDQVMADYVAELNRSLQAGAGRPYSTDGSGFLRQYDQLWRAKLDL